MPSTVADAWGNSGAWTLRFFSRNRAVFSNRVLGVLPKWKMGGEVLAPKYLSNSRPWRGCLFVFVHAKKESWRVFVVPWMSLIPPGPCGTVPYTAVFTWVKGTKYSLGIRWCRIMVWNKILLGGKEGACFRKQTAADTGESCASFWIQNFVSESSNF